MGMDSFRRGQPVLWMMCVILLLPATVITKDKKLPPTKSIRGHVSDSNKKSLVGAKVFIVTVKKKITTILVTNEEGLYSIYGLDPKEDYEVHAEYQGAISEKRSVSAYLNRFDNVFNFELSQGKSGQSAQSLVANRQVSLRTPDGMNLAASWFIPTGGVQAKGAPAVLALHGFGENGQVWEGLIQKFLLPAGFCALSVDLRGHGNSTDKSGAKVPAEAAWMSDPRQFPLDVATAIHWLKSQREVDPERIAVIGCELGGDLAYFASGTLEEVRSAVVISGDADNCKHLAEGSKDFQPHSILYLAADGNQRSVTSAREMEKLTGFPVRVHIYENADLKGIKILQEVPDAMRLLVDWLTKM
jgi:pimeloyl-ACP methyl ester carboxylesterase